MRAASVNVAGGANRVKKEKGRTEALRTPVSGESDNRDPAPRPLRRRPGGRAYSCSNLVMTQRPRRAMFAASSLRSYILMVIL